MDLSLTSSQDLSLTNSQERVLQTYIEYDCDITQKEIADKLCNSPRTIEKHTWNMCKANNANTLSGLAFRYLRKHKNLLSIIFVGFQLFSIGYRNMKTKTHRSFVKIGNVKTLSKTRTKNIKLIYA